MESQKRQSTPELRPARLKQKGTLAGFAKKLGISEGGLSRLENGFVGRVDVRLAFKIEKVYGIPIEAWRPKEDEP